MNNSPDPRQSQFGTALAPDPNLAVSAAFDKRFVIESNLTKSETRLVYLARDLRPQSPDHERLVRLRVLPERLSSDPRQVELFRLESCAAAKLSHRNILRTSEAEEINGIFFCVAEERTDLRTLRDHLKAQGWMSTDEALRVGRQIADALEYAHRQGVLHLTLNPEVVLLAQDGAVLVKGFGIGCHREMAWAQQERSRYCMPQYISPEQILSAGIGWQSDLYLLGLILYEMLTDRAPFESEDRASLLRKHLTRTPPAPHDFRPEVSREVSRLVLNLLGKRPDERPYDVTAFISILEHCIAAGLTAEVEQEEVTPSALSDDLTSPPEQFEFGLLSEARDFEESESPYESWLAPEEPWEHGTDDSESAAGGAPGGEVFQEVVVQRGSSNEEYHHSADLSDAEEKPIAADQVAPSILEPMLQSYGGTEDPGPAIKAEKFKKARPGRAAWMVGLLLLGAAFFWGSRGFHMNHKAVEPPPQAVAGAQNGGALAAGSIESSTPESLGQQSSHEVTAKVEPISTAPDKKPLVTKEDGVLQTPRPEESSPQEAPASGKPVTSPPAVSNVEASPMQPSDRPAGILESVPSQSASSQPAPVPEQAPTIETPSVKIIRKSGDVLQNTAIIRPKPVYPKTAHAAGVRGSVTVEVTIDEEGSVIAARPISGPESLQAAAADAARRWKWIPTKVGRSRAKVVGTITFRLEP